MGEVISFLDKMKLKQIEHEDKASKLIEQARECEAKDMNEWMLIYVSLASEELKHSIDLRKQILNIEHPQQHIATINVVTAPIEQTEPVDLLPLYHTPKL